MKYERPLILAIVIKAAGDRVIFNELRCKYRRFQGRQDEDEDNTIAGRAARGLTLSSCFNGLAQEETLSGDD